MSRTCGHFYAPRDKLLKGLVCFFRFNFKKMFFAYPLKLDKHFFLLLSHNNVKHCTLPPVCSNAVFGHVCIQGKGLPDPAASFSNYHNI